MLDRPRTSPHVSRVLYCRSGLLTLPDSGGERGVVVSQISAELSEGQRLPLHWPPKKEAAGFTFYIFQCGSNLQAKVGKPGLILLLREYPGVLLPLFPHPSPC